jgi:hypothetical protein
MTEAMTSRPSRWAAKKKRASPTMGAKRPAAESTRKAGEVAWAAPVTAIVYVPGATTGSKSNR